MSAYILFEAWGEGDSYTELKYENIFVNELEALDAMEKRWGDFTQQGSVYFEVNPVHPTMEIAMQFSTYPWVLLKENELSEVSDSLGHNEFGGFVLLEVLEMYDITPIESRDTE